MVKGGVKKAGVVKGGVAYSGLSRSLWSAGMEDKLGRLLASQTRSEGLSIFVELWMGFLTSLFYVLLLLLSSSSSSSSFSYSSLREPTD